MNDDLVSIIVPIYNSEEHLVESLESILNQTWKKIEIIAVDDGSTDNSLKILQNYSEKIKIVSQKNHGLASALNSGIKEMNGTWFKWFSPDDVMYSHAIETLITTAKNLGDKTIVYSNWDIIDKSGKILRSFNESNYNNLNEFEFNVRLLDGQQINVNTSLIPSSLLSKSLPINKNIDPILIDYNLFLELGLLNEGKFHLLQKPLIKFRVHEKQLSHKNIAKSLENLVLVRNNLLNKLEKEKRNQYLVALEKYQKNKSLSRKSMESGLKLMSLVLPNSVTDKILVFYLNKIRQKR